MVKLMGSIRVHDAGLIAWCEYLPEQRCVRCGGDIIQDDGLAWIEGHRIAECEFGTVGSPLYSPLWLDLDTVDASDEELAEIELDALPCA